MGTDKMNKAEIFYKDIGDYLSREEKLRIVSEDKSILNPALAMTKITPNEHGDWINKRNSKFDDFIPLEPEKKFDDRTQSFFLTYAIGIATNRDAWVYNFSEKSLKNNMKKMIGFYNEQRNAFYIAKKQNEKLKVEDFIDNNPERISWTRSLRNDVDKNVIHKFKEDEMIKSLHRPFTMNCLYREKSFIESPGLWSQLLPSKDSTNLLICVHGLGGKKDFSTIMTNCLTDLNSLEAGSQCFPLYWYEKKEKIQKNLFENAEDEYIRREAISDFIFEQATTRYGNRVTKEDIFYYVYGILHHPDYRKIFANDLKKMLPRLPLVEKAADFWVFSKAGRELANLHLNYEEQPVPKEVLINSKPLPKNPFPANELTVNQMRFPSKGQKDTIIYNSYLIISNIPAKAYEYIVNGKSAVKWVMERYAVTTHKESGITNNPNDWATEHNNPQYILDLLLSVIAVSIKTVDIVAGLPRVEWE
jgi:predicted helicase